MIGETTMKRLGKRLTYSITTVTLALFLLVGGATAADYPVSFRDSGNHEITVKQRPQRVVSLVPSVTDAVFALGAQDALVGITYHSTYPAEVNSKTVVGGFFRPSPTRIAQLRPDVVFISRIQKRVRKELNQSETVLIEVDHRSMDDAYRTIELLGKIFDREHKAAELIAGIKAKVEKVRKKVALIPKSKRKRVMRLMGINHLMTPGDDSFQNEFIRVAGGIPPTLGKNGSVVTMSKQEWQEFNPQVIYYCGRKWQLSKKYFDKPGWSDVDAVRHLSYLRFPCELTCRASVHMGDFIAWLAASVYPEEFQDKEADVTKEGLVTSRQLELDLDYATSSRIVTSMIRDFPHQTLLIDLKEPMAVVSSLEGSLTSCQSVGNHHLPPPAWDLGHDMPVKELKATVCKVVGRDPEKTSLLFTGAKMDHVSIQKRQYKEMVVYALVTAGVGTNAIRSGTDTGTFYEPGTINILVLSNMQLTPRAMTRAIINSTEGKTAALQDLDIRSCYTPSAQATGTGTDNIIVVEGRGPKIDNAGGHSKFGELVAKAVHAGVKEAIAKQNGLVEKRNVFQRMHERNIDVFGIASQCSHLSPTDKQRMAAQLEDLLLQPAYAGFIESAFSLSDAYKKGLVCDLGPFERVCGKVSDGLSGRKGGSIKRYLPNDSAPQVVRMAFDALISGLHNRASE